MGISVWRANSQANKIGDYANTLRKVSTKLNNFKIDINNQWQATETAIINRGIDSISTEVNNLSSALNSLKDDIIAVANEIKREEEARARAAAEARAKAAAKKP